MIEHLPGGHVHEAAQQPPGQQASEKGEKRAQARQQDQGGGYGGPQLVHPLRAEKLGDHDAGAVAEADGEGQEDERQRAGRAGGGQGVLGYEVAHHDAVHRVVELLQKVAGHDRQREQEDLFPLRSHRHIVFFEGRRRHDAPPADFYSNIQYNINDEDVQGLAGAGTR